MHTSFIIDSFFLLSVFSAATCNILPLVILRYICELIDNYRNYNTTASNKDFFLENTQTYVTLQNTKVI